ncbi:MAG: GDP-mannose 4,6-dehydratase [Azospirillaceae bacterium]|nr:GDP-mannose 4,6-dehydratase [Azospirillaceae bacterium]
MSQKTALILGVSGQDGAYLAKHLLSKGYEVHGSSRRDKYQRIANLERLGIHDDVTVHSIQTDDFYSLYRTLRELRPDEIYNLSGQTSVGLSFEVPIETFGSIANGTVNILECLRMLDTPAKLFNAGSSECFGNTPVPATEETPFQPRSPYASAKAAAFWMTANYREAYHLPVCTGILFNHESPLRPSQFVTRKIIAAAARISRGSAERLKLGRLSIYRDWGWAPEYVDAMWRMLQRDTLEDFVIATGESRSLEDFVALVFETVGLNWHDHVDVDSHFFRPSEIDHSVGNPLKAQRLLGWKAEMGISSTIAELMAHELSDGRLIPSSDDPDLRPGSSPSDAGAVIGRPPPIPNGDEFHSTQFGMRPGVLSGKALPLVPGGPGLFVVDQVGQPLTAPARGVQAKQVDEPAAFHRDAPLKPGRHVVLPQPRQARFRLQQLVRGIPQRIQLPPEGAGVIAGAVQAVRPEFQDHVGPPALAQQLASAPQDAGLRSLGVGLQQRRQTLAPEKQLIQRPDVDGYGIAVFVMGE